MLKSLKIRFALMIAAASLLLVGGTSAASATTSTDPTGGAGDSFVTDIENYLKDHLIAAVLGLAVIGVIVALVIKWGKKGAKAS